MSVRHIGDYEDELLAELVARHDAVQSKRPRGPSSGFSGFDKGMGGYLRPGVYAIHGQPGVGKALDNDTLVLTPKGPARMGSLKCGDRVIGRNGCPTTVWGVFPQGVREAYAVRFTDDTEVVCDIDHLWGVTSKNIGYEVLTLAEMLKVGLRRTDAREKSHRSSRYGIPSLSAPVRFEESDDLPLHPYVLGVLLGDGCLTKSSPRLTSADPEVVERVREYLPSGCTIERLRYGKYEYLITGERGENPVLDAIRELGLDGHRSESKFIPDAYKLAAPDTRLLVLQGLMDTDGHVGLRGDPHCHVEFSSSSPTLAEDFLFLLRSLGGSGRVIIRSTKRLPHHRISVAFPTGLNPFLLQRKAQRVRHRVRYLPGKRVVSVEVVTPREMTCIRVEAADGLFVLADGTVTHNTQLALQMAAECGFPALFLTCEMEPLELLARHVARVCRIPRAGLFTGNSAPDEDMARYFRAVAQKPGLHFMDGRDGEHPATTKELVLALAEVRGYSDHCLLVVDSLNSWAESTAMVEQTEYQFLGKAMADLRSLVKTVGCPIITMTERNRASSERGGLNAAAGTRKIEYSADVLISLSRDDGDGAKSTVFSGVDVIDATVDKNRFGRRGYKMSLSFGRDDMNFSEQGLRYG